MDEVELLEANSRYARIGHPDGSESTVSLHHLPPQGSSININDASNLHQYNGNDDSMNTNTPSSIQTYNNEVDNGTPSFNVHDTLTVEKSSSPLRKSQRTDRAPNHLDLWFNLYGTGNSIHYTC